MWWSSSGWEPNTDTGTPRAAHTLLKFTPAAITRTITSKAPGSGTSISSSWKASIGSPSRSWRITQAAIVSGSSPGSVSTSGDSVQVNCHGDGTSLVGGGEAYRRLVGRPAAPVTLAPACAPAPRRLGRPPRWRRRHRGRRRDRLRPGATRRRDQHQASAAPTSATTPASARPLPTAVTNASRTAGATSAL